MKNFKNISKGEELSYQSGASEYKGIVVAKGEDHFIVVTGDAEMELWKVGARVGATVYPEQIVEDPDQRLKQHLVQMEKLIMNQRYAIQDEDYQTASEIELEIEDLILKFNENEN